MDDGCLVFEQRRVDDHECMSGLSLCRIPRKEVDLLGPTYELKSKILYAYMKRYFTAYCD